LISSVSGIRGVFNGDFPPEEFARFASNFAEADGSSEFLLGRDTRASGPPAERAVLAALLARGADVVDFGVISTPALFRESRTRSRPAIMVTASHNEPQFNGLKFIVGGAGASGQLMEAVVAGRRETGDAFARGRVARAPDPRYGRDLVKIFGEGSCEGVRVAADLGGGAAIPSAVSILWRLGCEVIPVNDIPGVFNRRVDPVSDPLDTLRKIVKSRRCDLGLAFDCDGDRLVLVDSKGGKRTGDFMLTLAASAILRERKEKRMVVSVDTTQAIEEVVRDAGGDVVRTKVGEANVVAGMRESGASLGGEGSSGGLIDGSFNWCRDSMLAALTIIREVKREGGAAFDSVRSYHQSREALSIPRAKALRAIKALAKKYPDANQTDGLKVTTSKKSWVLVRPSGTEDSVRVSAEAGSAAEADRLVASFAKKLRELSR
jgi:phosphomannomutase